MRHYKARVNKYEININMINMTNKYDKHEIGKKRKNDLLNILTFRMKHNR